MSCRFQFRRILRVVLGAVLLVYGNLCSAGSVTDDIHDCRDDSPISRSAAKAQGAAQEQTAAISKAHNVRLFWGASVPSGPAPGDKIEGYLVERKEVGKDANFEQISLVPIRETGCADYGVSANHTYLYRVIAVSFRHLKSKPSNEAHAVVPER